MTHLRARAAGMNLLELLVVILILSIILALAVPALLRGRIAGNEASAVASLKAIFIAEQQYRIVSGTNAYTNLGDLNTALPNYVDPVLATSIKSGYSFYVVTNGGAVFTAGCSPTKYGKTGKRYFLIDLSSVIHYNYNAVATTGDPPVE